MPAKQVRAIRSALDLFGLLDWSDDGIDAARDHLSDYLDDVEASIARGKESMGEPRGRRAAEKAGGAS